MSNQTRVRSRELREAQRAAAAKQARRQQVLKLVGGVAILALVVAIGFAVVQAAGGDGDSASGKVVTPANLTDGAIAVGQEDAPVTVEIYFDYMCPACGQLEAVNGAELDRLVEDGTANVLLRPISFLDRTSNGTKYSTRAANALATVADSAPESAWAFHQALYAAQPQEGSTGLSDDEIAEIAEEAGVPQGVAATFTDDVHEGWVESVTRKSFDDGVSGTPTVLVDGKKFDGDLYTQGPLTRAIQAAAGDR